MIWHSSSITDIEAKAATDAMRGLSEKTAAQKLVRYGKNIITEKKKTPFILRFLSQMKDTMIIILIIAAVLSALVNFISGTPDWADPIIIVAIVIINALLGAFEEARAEKALDSLKSMTTPSAKVIRDGVCCEIDSALLVPGDVILLEAGDYVPADARLCEAYSLQCDESVLTGESLPVQKEAGVICDDITPIAERINMVYSGCAVSYGRGRAIVTETGSYTEMGKIALMLKDEDPSITPLQIKLTKLGKTLGIIALIICAVIFILGIIMRQGTLSMFMTAVSLAVAAIPEGLPAIVTVVLALGVRRMVGKNAIVRSLPAVETLGSASVICSDKTGTLTQNKMTVMKVFANSAMYDYDAHTPVRDEAKSLLRLAALCCDGKVEVKDGVETSIGDPTETAIVRAAMTALDTDKYTLDMTYPRMAELPFDSERKLMTVVCVIDSRPYAIVKGGIDILLDRCENIESEAVEKANLDMAKDALRVLGIAIKPLDEVPANPTESELEYGLTFVGLIGMIDPPREEVRDAIKQCRRAGIIPVMITGDHVVTASAIARRLGIMGDNDTAVTGAELDEMDDDTLARRLEHIRVYARVSPENKIRIVHAWQQKGMVVAMTGDGVNDAPALSAADIGCAMGITGTDVAKGAADMTLTDDNFSTIVAAVKEGRSIFENIRKSVHYLLSCNFGEILTVFVGMIIFGGAVLSPVLLLWLNLITDSLPALALGFEPSHDNIMSRPPRDKNESIFARGLGIDCIWQGILFAALTLAAYGIGVTFGGAIYGKTMAFAVLCFSQIIHAINCRSHESIIKVGLFENLYMWGAVGIGVALMVILLTVPALRGFFGLAALDASHIWIIILLSLSLFVVSEAVKLCKWVYNKFFTKQSLGGAKTMNYENELNLWLERATADPDLKAELMQYSDNAEEIADRFWRDLEFGTGGLRGVIGAGTNRMNIYTVGRATQGLAEYIKSSFDAPSVAIAYDSRIKSELFARHAAGVFAANGIKVYIYKELMPTPMLSWAVRYHGCSAGVVVTASHNPSKYNGYKVYGPDGCQLTLDASEKVLNIINSTDIFDGVKSVDFNAAMQNGMVEYISDEAICDYLDKVKSYSIHGDVLCDTDFSVVYTPLNGAGNKPVRAILDKIGIKNVTVVRSQEMPDGNFPTAPYPNPEIKQAFEEALKVADEVHPDLLLATDPDSDRVGIAVKNDDGEYTLMSGNEVGALLLDYIITERKAKGTLPERPVAVKTIVTSDIAAKIAEKNGCEIRNVLTGFKFIGEQIALLEADGEEDRYIFGFEESYGYLAGGYVRDKDAVIGSMLICEMAAFYKTKGVSLLDKMQALYEEYGYYKHTQLSFAYEGQSGMQKMSEIMSGLRGNAPEKIGGYDVLRINDYQKRISTDVKTGANSPITLPVSNVIGFELVGGNSVIVRPSGTEPKIKFYLTAVGKNNDECEQIIAALGDDMKQITQ